MLCMKVRKWGLSNCILKYCQPSCRACGALQAVLQKNPCSKLHQICLRMHSSGMILIRLSDPRSRTSWCIKGTDEPTLVTNPSVPMNHDLSDSESLILIQIISKGCTLSDSSAYPFWRFWWAPGIMSIIHYSCTGLKGKQRYIWIK